MIGARKILADSLRQGVRAKHTLPELAYGYEALEPIISRDIMMLHHQKHHQTYVTNLNAAEEKLQAAISKNDTSQIIALAPALKFNGGGHINHTIFWQNLSPKSTTPGPKITEAINKSFGSFDKMKELLTAASVGVQGSGWGWLGYDKVSGQIKIAACANQDPLQATTGLVPLLGIDVWEHAYYLQYKNVRADYVKAIFEIINWNDVEERLKKAS
uniref:Superoxide dismutase n=1 Tax=Dastarcus helophoroides TaxID=1169899 RepID=A0A075W8N1_9CUCU|nr:Mn superoxide dismutase [Dastarcus helophoroides]